MSKLCRVALQVPKLRQSQRQADKREAEESQFPQTESQSQHEPVPKPVLGKGKGRGNLNIFIDLNADVIQLIYRHSLVQYLSFFRQKIEHRYAAISEAGTPRRHYGQSKRSVR